MKLFAVVGTAGLAALLSISMPVYAQDESHPQEEKRAEPDGKEARQPDKQADKRAEQDKEQDKKQDERADHQANQDRDKHSDQQARPDDHRDQPAQAKQGGRIPDDRFRANFGRQHTFSIGHPVMVGGSPQFQYGGYTFVMVQPWPTGWAYTDVVYVDYIDGEYFLLSPVHPGVQIAINVIL
jgi:hypothetical protein